MIGPLEQAEIEELLQEETVGRIGCASVDRTYVVPISYAYDGEAIYGHSFDGLKLRMMRENPSVCFEIDHVEGVNNWRSVIAWGRFEELTGPDAMRGLHLLMQRFAGLVSVADAHGGNAHGRVAPGTKPPEAFVYRIRLAEKTGRFERT